jgi:hypothetical protein
MPLPANVCRELLLLRARGGFRTRRLEARGEATVASFVEEKTDHVSLYQLDTLRITGVQAIFVNDHLQSVEPLLPALARYVFVDASPELTRVGRLIHPLRLAFEDHATNHSRHHCFPARLLERPYVRQDRVLYIDSTVMLSPYIGVVRDVLFGECEPNEIRTQEARTSAVAHAKDRCGGIMCGGPRASNRDRRLDI